MYRQARIRNGGTFGALKITLKCKSHFFNYLLAQGDAAMLTDGNRKRRLADRVKQLTENRSETGLSEGFRGVLLLLLKTPFVTAG
jgi:hypothetical protein